MEFIQNINYFHFIRLILIPLIGLPIVWIGARLTKKILTEKVSAHIAMLIGNILFYFGLGFVGISLIQELGYNLSALLGAAGVVGIAVGFAAKTTVSNIISGIFLLIERPFVVGDRINCGNNSGIVESIDLMSVKLRTISGQLVRIPNEILIGQTMTNISFYPKRRLVYKLEIQPSQNLEQVVEFVKQMVLDEPSILAEPKPNVAVQAYSQYAIEIRLSIWLKQKDCKTIFFKLNDHLQQFAKEQNIWIGIKEQ